MYSSLRTLIDVVIEEQWRGLFNIQNHDYCKTDKFSKNRIKLGKKALFLNMKHLILLVRIVFFNQLPLFSYFKSRLSGTPDFGHFGSVYERKKLVINRMPKKKQINNKAYRIWITIQASEQLRALKVVQLCLSIVKQRCWQRH